MGVRQLLTNHWPNVNIQTYKKWSAAVIIKNIVHKFKVYVLLGLGAIKKRCYP